MPERSVSKTARTSPSTEAAPVATASELWGRWVRDGGLEPEGRDALLVAEIADALALGESGFLGSLERHEIGVEQLVDAVLVALQPFSMMMRELLAVFRRAGAGRSDENVVIEFDFDRSKAAVTLGLREFAVQVERAGFVERSGERILHNLDTSSDLLGILLSVTARPGAPPIAGAEDQPESVREVYRIWSIIDACTRAVPDGAGAAREARDFSPGARGEPSGWELAQLRASHWAERARPHVAELVRVGGGEWRTALDEWFAHLPRVSTTIRERVALVEELLSLPAWGKRNELYSAWVYTRIVDALDPGVQLHASGGRISFSFRGSHLATVDRGTRVHVWTEQRFPIDQPRGKGRKKSIQPDYTVLAEPATAAASAVVSVECKHYLEPCRRNFGLALADYLRGLPNARIILVNYGPANDAPLALVDEADRPRAHVIGEFRPGRQPALDRFREIVTASLLAREEAPSAPSRRPESVTAPIEGAGVGASTLPARRGSLLVSLDWQRAPSDLDLHAWRETSTGNEHVFHARPGALGAEPFSRLERDERTAPGSETMRFERVERRVVLAVHQYSSDGDLLDAQPTVRLQTPDLVIEARPPTDGRGAWWHVGTYDPSTGAFTPAQLRSSNPPLHEGAR